MKTLRHAIILIGLLAVMAGCSAAMDSFEAPAQSAAMPAEEAFYEAEEGAAEVAPGEPNFSDSSSVPLEDFLAQASQQQQARVIIYTGNIALVVKDTQESARSITALAGEQGGYVSSSNLYQSGEVLRGSISIRVPAERYQEVMAQLRAMALRVERESSSSQDVTEEFTDLQARKENLEHTESALQELLDERQRVGSTSDILEVQRELTNVRGQIEQIEGRLRYLANQAALSTINIELTPDVLYQPVSVAGWEPQGVAKEALQALVAALQALVNLTIWIVIFVLPLLIIFIIPIVVIVVIIRWVWRRSRRKKPVAQKKSEDRSQSSPEETGK